jgi:hypothetical protein
MSGTIAEQAIYVRHVGGLKESQIGEIVGAAPNTVRSWVHLRRTPSGARADRLLELAATIRQLELIMQPQHIPVWLLSPSPALDNEKPAHLLAEGEYDRVMRLIAGMLSPTAT